MGAFTPIDQIWYPDEDDTAEQNVNMAAMASSIEDGLGLRLREQEKLVSAVLTVQPSPYNIALTATANTTIPFIVSSFGYLVGDMTLSNGVITIATPGVYFISSTLTFENLAGWYTHTVQVSGVEKVRGFSHQPNGGSFQYSAQTAVVKLDAGDTIRTAVQTSAGTSSIRNLSVAGNTMTVTLLKPL